MLRRIALAFALALAPVLAAAQSLAIGLAADVTSIDPHYHVIGPNQNVAEHVFDTLIYRDPRQKLIPGLATSWKTIDDVTWEIKLRPGVQFHDGTPLTPEDVLFSLERPATIRNSPSPFTVYTKGIASAQAVDATTIRIRTNGPYPLLPNDLSVVPIVSKRAAANATTEDFNTGKATIGTGPYRFVRWAKGDRIELSRNDAYWGPKAPWEKVTLRLIPADPARVAALLTGDVQAIDAVPTADLAKLRANPDIRLAQVISYRLIYLHLDAARDRSPFITDKAGKPLDRNPLKDIRVRRAISKAINRPLIVDRVMEGAAAQSGQLMAEGFFGYTDKLKTEPYDLDGARKLLAEAGWADGFGIVVHGPNDRYVNDERVAQSLAGMLTRAGIQTTVVTMPSSVYFSRANRLEFSLMFLGWGADTGEASSPLKALLATYDAPKGLGTTNRGRYSNAKMDAVLAQALATVDDRKREALLQQATTIAVEDLGIIPLYHQVNIWATRKGLAYSPRTDERTYAHQIAPQR